MSGIYIPMEMPTNCWYCHFQDCGNCVLNNHKVVDNCIMEDRRDADCPLIPVPEHGRLLKVLKTERECVSRDCDRNCGKCDLSMERSEILSAYDALIAVLGAPPSSRQIRRERDGQHLH